MKNIFIIIALCLTLGLASCGWVETSDNGDLDGFWHVEEIDTLATGGVLDMSQKTMFWGIQGHLLYFQNEQYQLYVSHFARQDTLLHIYDLRHNDRINGDSLVDDMTPLYPYGLHATDMRLHIEHLSGSKMTLRSDSLRIKFRKF